MTTSRKILILSVALGALASCAKTEPSGCAGWRPVTVSESTLDYLNKNDKQALSEIVGHAEFGKKMGCF